MLKNKEKNKKRKLNRKKYMSFAVIATVVLLVLMIVHYAVSILQNRKKIIEQYGVLQGTQAKLLAASLEGKSEQDMIDVIKSRLEVSGENWAYLMLDGEMIFMRDDNTTESMAYLKAKGAMADYLAESGGIYSSASVTGTDYVCGIYTTKNYILSNYGVGEFENYVILGFVVMFLVLGAMIIQYSIYLNRTMAEREAVTKELRDRNTKFREYEKLSAEYKDQILDYESGQRNDIKKVYDMDIVDALLSKSKDVELYPICFMYVSVVMADRYYSKDELMAIMELIKSNVKKKHVTAEISKGFFTVIMYKTDIAEAESLRNVILRQWESFPIPKQDTSIKISLYQVKENDDPRRVFYREKDKVSYEI
jgi:hypothetical protein